MTVPGARGEEIDGHGTTESPLEMPSFKRTTLYMGRALRFRCPNCGEGKVLGGWGAVRERCSHCNLRFERSGPEYFTGAMFCNFLIAEFLFATSFATAVVLTWPDVPWDAMTWIAVAGAVIVPVALYPFSKVAWLAIDSLVRPVTPEETSREIPGAATV
ncbi:MAG: DUF983 domain-containing protein [Phycisphaerae bacterium]|nr:DUF983 domain-containing protein [Gemmatimonadaceae bacterium]